MPGRQGQWPGIHGLRLCQAGPLFGSSSLVVDAPELEGCLTTLCLVGSLCFALPFQVILCANHLGYQDEVNTILAHELVHAYDYCRVKNMDWHNLRHHACSEVRRLTLLEGHTHEHKHTRTGPICEGQVCAGLSSPVRAGC